MVFGLGGLLVRLLCEAMLLAPVILNPVVRIRVHSCLEDPRYVVAFFWVTTLPERAFSLAKAGSDAKFCHSWGSFLISYSSSRAILIPQVTVTLAGYNVSPKCGCGYNCPIR